MRVQIRFQLVIGGWVAYSSIIADKFHLLLQAALNDDVVLVPASLAIARHRARGFRRAFSDLDTLGGNWNWWST
jgi:hypothetical protein